MNKDKNNLNTPELDLDDKDIKDINTTDLDTGTELDKIVDDATANFIDDLVAKLELDIDDDTRVELSATISQALREMYELGKSEKDTDEGLTPDELEELDEAYKTKVTEAMAKIEGFYTKLLEKAACGLKNKIKVKATKAKKQNLKLVEQLNTFLNAFIKDNISKESVVKEEEFKRLKTFYDSIREALFVNNSEIQETISEKVKEVEGIVADLKERYNKSIKDRIVLKEQLQTYQKEELINESVKDLDPRVAKAVRRRLVAETVDSIKKNVKEIVLEEENHIDKRREAAREVLDIKDKRKDVILESDGDTKTSKSLMDVYAEEIDRLSKF